MFLIQTCNSHYLQTRPVHLQGADRKTPYITHYKLLTYTYNTTKHINTTQDEKRAKLVKKDFQKLWHIEKQGTILKNNIQVLPESISINQS